MYKGINNSENLPYSLYSVRLRKGYLDFVIQLKGTTMTNQGYFLQMKWIIPIYTLCACFNMKAIILSLQEFLSLDNKKLNFVMYTGQRGQRGLIVEKLVSSTVPL